MFTLDHGRIEVVWQLGTSGKLQGSASLYEPVLEVIHQSQLPKAEAATPLPATGKPVREASGFPIEVERIAVHDGAVIFVDETVPAREVLRIRELQVTVENFSTRRAASEGLPTLVVARGLVGEAGHVALFATLNPWSPNLDFAGRAELVGLRATELAEFVDAASAVEPTAGSISAFAEFSVRNGQLSGGVRPVLTNLDVEQADPGVLEQLQTWLAEAAVELFSDERSGGSEVLGTTLPLQGDLRQPQPQIGTALLGVVENAFLEAINFGFEQLPPSASAEE